VFFSYPLSLCDKKGGVIFIFGPGMYFQIGQVIFVPEWPKGEFVSIIGLILCLDKILFVKMLFYKGFRYSKVFQKILHCLIVRRFPIPCQSSGRSCHPVRTLICPLFHPSGRRVLPFGRPDRTCIIRPDDVLSPSGPSLFREATVPACIRPDVSAARPDASQ
jgi:hypothetical protein